MSFSKPNNLGKSDDEKKSKKDVLDYFKSINEEANITILPGDISTLNFITENELIAEDIFTNQHLDYITQNIYFNYNSANIPELGINQLESLADFLIDNKNVKVDIACYTDSRGNNSYNKQLSQQRSDNIRIYLLSKGITGERVITSAMGEKNPIVDCENVKCDDDKHAQNRRAELKIIWN